MLRRAAALAILLAATSISSVSAGSAPILYRGTIYPLGDIVAEGAIHAPADHFRAATWSLEGPGPLIRGSTARMTVDEWRWTAPPGPEPDWDPPASASRTSHTTSLVNASADVLRLAANNQWRLRAGPAATLRVDTLGDCRVSTEAIAVGASLLMSGANNLDVRCARGGINATLPTPATELSAFGADVWVRGMSSASSEPYMATIRTGLFVLPNASVATHDHVLRRLTLQLDAAGWRGAACEIQFQSPVIQIGGELRLPAFAGTLWVGEAPVTNATGSTDASGTFLLFTNGKQRGVPGIGIGGSGLDDAPAPPVGALAPSANRVPVDLAIIASATATLVFLHWLFPRGSAMALAFFTRLTPIKALDHPLRRAIFELVEANPGIRLHEAARELHVRPSTLIHHTAVLQRQALLTIHKEGRRTALLPRRPVSDVHAQVLLRTPIVQRVLRALPQGRAVSQAELSMMVGVSQSYLSRVLRRLDAAGLIRRHRVARGTSYLRTA